jgi:hypothetical protein
VDEDLRAGNVEDRQVKAEGIWWIVVMMKMVRRETRR